jgi:predicted metal-dependent hydrolase
LIQAGHHNTAVPYSVRVSNRARRARLQLSSSGDLTVIVPRGFDHRDIAGMVDSHQVWITRTRERLRRQALVEAPAAAVMLPEVIHLRAVDQQWRVVYSEGPGSSVRAKEGRGAELHISGATADYKLVHAVLRTWLTARTKTVIVPRLYRLAGEHGFTISAATVRSQRTRWGSCSARGAISLNIRLLLVPDDLVRYVLIHELAHTRQLNHSAKFWSLVESIEPDYRRQRKLLREEGDSLPNWIAF